MVEQKRTESNPRACFLEPGDSRLRDMAAGVDPNDIQKPEIQNAIRQMLSVTEAVRQNWENARMVGLAAPQIGIPLRIILVDTETDSKKPGNLAAYINPEIIWRSQDIVARPERCMSLPEEIVGIVERPEKILFKAFDRDGQIVEGLLSGLQAMIFQHETDHLDGILLIDRVKSPFDIHLVKKPEEKNHLESWHDWPNICPLDKLKPLATNGN